MSQRSSGYARQERDSYETPHWVTYALLPHLPPPPRRVWEPACGSGKMVFVLRSAGYSVYPSDIEDGKDFLTTSVRANLIVTNPPYALATEFIERALELSSVVAMLLRTDFDHARTRAHLFEKNPFFAKKVVLTRRIQWFADSTAAPSFNHAWFLWDRTNTNPPTLAYGPPMIEKIAKPAIRLRGTVYAKAPPAGHSEILRALGVGGLEGQQGFVTTTGRFVDRYAALEIARAAGQLRADRLWARELFTGDWK